MERIRGGAGAGTDGPQEILDVVVREHPGDDDFGGVAVQRIVDDRTKRAGRLFDHHVGDAAIQGGGVQQGDAGRALAVSGDGRDVHIGPRRQEIHGVNDLIHPHAEKRLADEFRA